MGVVAGDLVETLSSPGPFTVFAPTNEAFDALPDGTLDSLLKPENKDQLVDILTYHVLPAQEGCGGACASKVFPPFDKFATVEGKELMVLRGDGTSGPDGFRVGAHVGHLSTVTGKDNFASNGIVHII